MEYWKPLVALSLGDIGQKELAAVGVVLAILWKFFSMGRKIGILEGKATQAQVVAAVAKDRADKAEDKTNTIINIQKERAVLKATTGDEPMLVQVPQTDKHRVTPEFRIKMQMMPDLAAKLREWWGQEGRQIRVENDQIMALHKACGAEILKDICAPLGKTDWECLMVALAYCKETSIVVPFKKE